MNVVLPPGLEDSYLFSALSLAALFATVLLLVKLLTLLWLNEAVPFGSPPHRVEVEIPKVLMSQINVPFTFKLADNVSSTYEGVNCLISSEVDYRLEAFWGVNIADLHHFLRQPWDFYGGSSSLEQTPLRECCQHVTSVLRDEGHEAKSVRVECPGGAESRLELGAPPRQCYPLVVFLCREPTASDLLPDQTVALISIVHIKDNTCTLPTSLLAQYLKQTNGRLTTFKQLYVSSSWSGYDSEDTGGGKTGVETPLCVVCQAHPTSRALLPCRHTCVCAVCFYKIYGCPLCRSPITSYFLIRGEEYFKGQDKQEFAPSSGSLSQWFQDRVTDLLGFER